jgi:hypothetical protein
MHRTIGAFACLDIPQFTLQTHVGSQHRPTATVDKKGIIILVSPAAWNHGVRPGQRTREALGHCGTLAIVRYRRKPRSAPSSPSSNSSIASAPRWKAIARAAPSRPQWSVLALRQPQRPAQLLLEALPEPHREVFRLGIAPTNLCLGCRSQGRGARLARFGDPAELTKPAANLEQSLDRLSTATQLLHELSRDQVASIRLLMRPDQQNGLQVEPEVEPLPVTDGDETLGEDARHRAGCGRYVPLQAGRLVGTYEQTSRESSARAAP